MALDVKFRQLLQGELAKTLDKITEDRKSNFSKTWRCKNEEDFLYEWHLGKVDDFCLNQYFIHYHKTPTNADKDEIRGILLVHARISETDWQ